MTTLVKVVTCELEGEFDDYESVWNDFLVLTNRLPDITILATQRHVFQNGGLSGVVIIGESHLAIHTWPELGRAYALFASCSSDESMSKFKIELARHWSVVRSSRE